MFSKKNRDTQNSPGAPQDKLAKRRRFWRKAGRRFLWTLAGLFVAHSALNIYASVQLNRELAAIRQKGDPLQFSEIEPPLVPPARNAALVYARATKSLHFSPEERSALQTSRRNVTPQIEKQIASAISNNREALDLARRAAFMPECRFPLDWKSDPTRMRFPYYAQVRELARLLATDARIKAKQGDGTAALLDARAIFGISHHLSEEPYLIGYLVAQSVNSLAHRALADALERVSLSVPQARALEASLPKDDWTKAFRRCLVGERMMGIFAFENLGKAASDIAEVEDETDEDFGFPPPSWTRAPLLWIWRPVLILDEVQTLRLWRRLLDSPGSQQVPRTPEFGRAQDEAVDNAPFNALLTKILFPVFSRASDNRDSAEVRRRQREVALALTCFRTAHGRYPTRLSEAQASWNKPLPLDPYSAKPFVYRPTAKGFVLYSIGVNRSDDGGVGPYTSGKGSNFSKDDLAWLNS